MQLRSKKLHGQQQQLTSGACPQSHSGAHNQGKSTRGSSIITELGVQGVQQVLQGVAQGQQLHLAQQAPQQQGRPLLRVLLQLAAPQPAPLVGQPLVLPQVPAVQGERRRQQHPLVLPVLVLVLLHQRQRQAQLVHQYLLPVRQRQVLQLRVHQQRALLVQGPLLLVQRQQVPLLVQVPVLVLLWQVPLMAQVLQGPQGHWGLVQPVVLALLPLAAAAAAARSLRRLVPDQPQALVAAAALQQPQALLQQLVQQGVQVVALPLASWVSVAAMQALLLLLVASPPQVTRQA